MSELHQQVWNWYSRESVQRAIVEVAKSREVVSVFREGKFGKRPDIIQYPSDVLQAVAEGTLAFHGSVERWSQPMKLDVGLTKEQLDELRSGWDLIIDIDVDNFLIARIAAKKIMDALKDHGVRNYSCKFTGGTSFHLGVPFESIPGKIDGKESRKVYPELFQRTLEYLKFYVKDQLRDAVLAVFSPSEVSQKINKKLPDLVGTDGNLDPFKFITIDIFSSRHLFRMPYSLHETKMHVSLPFKPSHIEKFEIEQALPKNVKIEEKFLNYVGGIHDAEGLIIEAVDWSTKQKVEIKEKLPNMKKMPKVKEIPEEYFPPCIKKMFNGMADGKKRAVFVLTTFLQNMGWGMDKIEERLLKWNEKNVPQLRPSYIRTQLRWHTRQDRSLLPPNCMNENFYKTLGLNVNCENLHKIGIKNPVTYAIRQANRKEKVNRK